MKVSDFKINIKETFGLDNTDFSFYKSGRDNALKRYDFQAEAKIQNVIFEITFRMYLRC